MKGENALENKQLFTKHNEREEKGKGGLESKCLKIQLLALDVFCDLKTFFEDFFISLRNYNLIMLW